MSKKGYNLIAYKQISGNRNNVLVLLYTFNTSVWSDGLQGHFTRWNLCSFRCQRQYIHVCVWCVCYLCVHAEVSVVAAEWGRCWTSQSGSSCCSSDSWGQKPNSVNPSACFKKKQSDLQNIWTLAVNHTQMSTNGFSERHQTFILSLFSSLSCEVMHYENTLSPHTLSWMSFVPLPKMDERPLQPCVTNSRCPL